MNTLRARNASWTGYLTLYTVLALSVCPPLSADNKKPASAPAPAKAAPAAKPAGGAPHGPSTSASHGPTTAGAHGPTTAGHGPTTATAGHGTTTSTAGRTTTTAGHTTTTSTAGHTTTTAGHTTTTATAGHTTAATAHTTTPAAGHTAAGTAGHASPAAHTAAAGHAADGGKLARGHTTVATKSGGAVTKRADGKVASLHDPKRGMEVHHSLSGNRRVVVERRDHTRVVAYRGGRGYVQRPYMYHGHEYAARGYYYHGGYYHNYYGRYYYRGVYVNPYYPAYYYGPAYYGWVYNPWVRPVPYAWGWAGNPWYGYYGAYFTPYPVYSNASLWLTDYMISASLQAAYQASLDAKIQAAALSNPAPLTPDVKQLIADEVRRQVALENTESQTAKGGEPDAASSSIQRMLTDGTQHIFISGQDLDVVDAAGTECALSQGDALQLTGQTAPDATAVTLAVLASKGGRECAKGDTVSVKLEDLQEMQNHMRETIDRGMQDLQKKQGQGGLPAAPAAAKAEPVQSAMAASAPPPPPEKEVAAELNEQARTPTKPNRKPLAKRPVRNRLPSLSASLRTK